MKSKWKPIVVSVLLSIFTISARAQPSTFKVQILDALDGKPYNDIQIIYSCDDPAQFKVTRKRIVTNSNGFAVVPYECKDRQQINISTFIANGETIWAGKVEECGYLQPQDIEQILNVGVISKPTAAGGIWCPTKVSKKMKPIPDQVIIFVKKPTWWQKHVAP